MKFYLEPTGKVFSAVESSEKGLTSAEAEQRLAKYGKNKLKEAEKDSLFKKFINSLTDPMIIMLLVAAAIQAVVTVLENGANFEFKDFADVLVILFVVIINTIMSLVQDSKAEGNLMKRKPRATTDGIFSHGAGFDMAWQGIYLAIIEIAAYVIGYRLEVGSFENMFFGGSAGHCVNAMAIAFLTVNFAEMMCAINMRSRTGSIFSKSMFKNMNWWLIGAFVVTTALTLTAIYIPGLSNDVFDIAPGTFQLNELLISAGLSVSTIPVFEIGKAIRRAAERRKEKKAA